MIHYRKLTFQHANLKRPVALVAGTIAGWHWSEVTKSTHIYTTGGVFPVLELDEEITAMIESLNNQEKKTDVSTGTTTVRQTDDVRENKTRSHGRRDSKRR